MSIIRTSYRSQVRMQTAEGKRGILENPLELNTLQNVFLHVVSVND